MTSREILQELVEIHLKRLQDEILSCPKYDFKYACRYCGSEWFSKTEKEHCSYCGQLLKEA